MANELESNSNDDWYAFTSAKSWLQADVDSSLDVYNKFLIAPVLKYTGNPSPTAVEFKPTSGMVRVFGEKHKQLDYLLFGEKDKNGRVLSEGIFSLLNYTTQPFTQSRLVVSKLNEANPPLSTMDVREILDALAVKGRLNDFLRLAHPDHGTEFKNWLVQHGVDWDYVFMHYDPEAKDSINFFAGYLLGAACSIATMKIFEGVFKLGSVAIGTGIKWFRYLGPVERCAIVSATQVVITDRVTPAQICEIASAIAKSAIPALKQMVDSWAKEFDAAMYSLAFFKAGYMVGEAVPQILDLVGLINGTLHLAVDVIERAVIQISKKVRQIEFDVLLKTLALDKETFAKLKLMIETGGYGELVLESGTVLQKANDEVGTVILATSKEGEILGASKIPSDLYIKQNGANLASDVVKSKSQLVNSPKTSPKLSLPSHLPIDKRYDRFITELEALIKQYTNGAVNPWATLRTRTIDPNAIKAIREILDKISPLERNAFLNDLARVANNTIRELQGNVRPYNILVEECSEANKKALIAVIGKEPELLGNSPPSREVIRKVWSQLNEITLDAHHFIESSMYRRFAKHFKRIATKDTWTSSDTMLAIAIPTSAHQRSIEATIKRLSQGSIPDDEVMKVARLWLEEGKVSGDSALNAAGSIKNLFDITAPLQRIVKSVEDVESSQVARNLKAVSASKPYLFVDGSLTAETLADAMRPPEGLNAMQRSEWLKKVANGEKLKFVVDPESNYGLVDLCDAYTAAYSVLWGGGTIKNVNVVGLADSVLPQIAAIRKAALDVAQKLTK